MSKKIVVALGLLLTALATQASARSLPREYPVEPVPAPVEDGGVRGQMWMEGLRIRFMPALRQLPRMEALRQWMPRRMDALRQWQPRRMDAAKTRRIDG